MAAEKVPIQVAHYESPDGLYVGTVSVDVSEGDDLRERVISVIKAHAQHEGHTVEPDDAWEIVLDTEEDEDDIV